MPFSSPGSRLSGINLDDLVKTPDFFNAKEDVCLRLSWQSVPGANERVRSVQNGLISPTEWKGPLSPAGYEAQEGA